MFIRVLLLLLFVSGMLFGLTQKELGRSIDLAGKQRMLSQKMTKELLLLQAGIEKEQNKRRLHKSRLLFAKTLQALQTGDKSLGLKVCSSPVVQKQLRKVEKIWRSFDNNLQKVLQQKGDKATLKALQEESLTLLKEMNKAVVLYVAQSKETTSKRAQAINLCGKERMLTQRMAKDLLLISQGVDRAKNHRDLQKMRVLFARILHGLQKGDRELGLEGTKLPKIKRQLQEAQKLFVAIEPALQKGTLSKQKLYETIQQLDRLLIEMDKAVKLYAKSIQREKQALKLSSIIGAYMQKKSVCNHGVNLLGRERMLSQKMTKEALLVAMGREQKTNQKRLLQSAKEFDATLEGFLKGDKRLELLPTKDRDVLAAIAKVEEVWKPFFSNLQRVSKNAKDKNTLLYLLKNNLELLKRANNLVQVYKKSQTKLTVLEKVRANIVDIAGRQRMLTQKMTKERLLITAGIAKEKNQKRLKETVALFDRSLKALLNGDKRERIAKPNNPQIKKQLEKVVALWKELKPLYLQTSLDKKGLDRVIAQNETLLNQMHQAVVLMERVVDY